MRLLRGLVRFAPLQPLTAAGALGICLAALACSDDNEHTRTTNSLSDASVDASADAGVDAAVEQSRTSSSRPTTSRDTSTAVTTRLPVDAGEPIETTDAALNSEEPETTVAVTSEPPTTDPSATANSSSTWTTTTADESSEPSRPATCGNGELDGNEMCCQQSDVDAALQTRFMAAELLLNGDLGCAPPQASQTNNVDYQLCGGECGTDLGCAVSASNVELTYDSETKTFTGIADVVIEGSVGLTVAALNQSVSCDTAHILLEEVTFGGDLVTDIEQRQTIVDVRNVDTELGIPEVTGCQQGNVISAAFLLMQAPHSNSGCRSCRTSARRLGRTTHRMPVLNQVPARGCGRHCSWVRI